jgi:uncharacterized protein
MNFVAREMELSLLNDLYRRDGAQFLIVYGRRRIGKTHLLNYWAENLSGRYLYWGATQTSRVNQLRRFSQALWEFMNPRANADPEFSYISWDAAFVEAARLAKEERLVLILDEFTYVMQADPEVPSILQHAWDHHLKASNLFLILSGSLAGIIQRTALDYQSPLYGRATARLKLQPMPFSALVDMLPNYKADRRVAVYAITGGVPAYIEQFDDRLNILQNLQERIVSPTNVMLTDAPFLLHEQLDEPRNYMSIIETIAAGYHSLTDVARMSGIPRSNISKYLSVLTELGYVERRVPATVRRPEQSKQGRYVITDPYLRFYFRFLAPNLSAIERGRTRQTISLLSDHLPDFIGTHTFEELCREWIDARAELDNFPFLPERVGSYWSKEAQVDVVAINWRTKDILLGECKWEQADVGRQVIQTLFDKTEKVLPKSRTWQVHYAFFSRHGFTEPAQELAQSKQALLISLNQIETDIRLWMKNQ